MHTLLLFCSLATVISAWNLAIVPQDHLLNRRSGDNFMVVCKVKDFDGAASDVKIEWYKDNKPIPRFGSTMTIERTYSSQLMINRPKPSDGGQYVCKADVNSEQQDISATVSFVDPPKFVDPQAEQHPEEGSRAEIVCKVEATEQVEVFWQFNDVTLDETSQRGYEFSDDKQTLYIPHYTSKKDDGEYKCNAAQYSSFETLKINVTGYARPTITVFDVPNGNRGFEGHNVELKCGAVGKPKPSYKWYFENQAKPIEDSDKHKVDDGLLIIESLAEDDAGSYKCVANNTVGHAEKTFDLTVYLRPKVQTETAYVKKEGEDVEIICKYHGDGHLEAKFVHDGQEYAVKSEVVKEEQPESDENSQEEAETTTASDTSSETQADDSEAQIEPTDDDNDEETTTAASREHVDADEKDEDAEENEEMRRWRRFVEDVHEQRVSVRQEEGKLILNIKQVSLDDAGPYYCLVSNEAGATNKTTNINIIHPPTLRHYSGQRVRSFDGNTITIFCDVSAVPAPTWKWYKDGSEVEANGASVRIDSQEGTSKVILQTNEGHNYGRYTCKADNGIGTFDKQIEVIHVVRPAVPTIMDCKQVLYPNYGRCSFEEGLYDEESGRPLEIEFLVSKTDEMGSDFDWKDALPVKVPFGNATTVPNLAPNTQYMVKARAINEAGESEYSEEVSLETTDPLAPQAPSEVHMECSESCIVSWSEPNDHGSPITGYRITVQEMEAAEEGDKEEDESGEKDKSGENADEAEDSSKDDNGNDDDETEADTTTDAQDVDVEHHADHEKSNPEDEEETTTTSHEHGKDEEDDDDAQTDPEHSHHRAARVHNSLTASQEKQVGRSTHSHDEKEDSEDDADTEVTQEDNGNHVPVGHPFIVEVGPDESQLELTHIKPFTVYKVSVMAINAIGEGEALEIEHKTDGSPKAVSAGISTHSILLAAAVGLAFLLLVVDFICYLTNRCGFIACICLNCFGRGPSDRKQRDIESGRPENSRLLDNAASSWKMPLTTTV